jgi:hypothetical protein
LHKLHCTGRVHRHGEVIHALRAGCKSISSHRKLLVVLLQHNQGPYWTLLPLTGLLPPVTAGGVVETTAPQPLKDVPPLVKSKHPRHQLTTKMHSTTVATTKPKHKDGELHKGKSSTPVAPKQTGLTPDTLHPASAHHALPCPAMPCVGALEPDQIGCWTACEGVTK